ncbi:MAG: hypothetical protein KGJ06_09885, partial [Pseudomonadota bacterium]|nr:hypothetical protein [Pseudomonadota bacterium]
ALFVSCVAVPAFADIGHVDVINRQPEPQYQPPAAPKDDALLTIRFNRNFVYFQQALKEGVASTQKIKPGAEYRVVSTIPPGDSASQTQRNGQKAQANLQSVLQELQADGVSQSQIHIETSTGQHGDPQVIQIFVK